MKRTVQRVFISLSLSSLVYTQAAQNESIWKTLPGEVYDNGKYLVEWGAIHNEKAYSVGFGGCNKDYDTYEPLYVNGTQTYFVWIADIESDIVGGSCQLILDCEFTGYKFISPDIPIAANPTDSTTASSPSAKRTSSAAQTSTAAQASRSATIPPATPSSQESKQENQKSKTKISGAQIAGITLGTAGVIALFVLAFLLIMWRRLKYDSVPKEQGSIKLAQAEGSRPKSVKELDSQELKRIAHEISPSCENFSMSQDQSRPISYEVPSGTKTDYARRSRVDADLPALLDLLDESVDPPAGEAVRATG